MKNLRLLAPDGRYVMIAFLRGPKTEVNFAELLPKRLTITGSTLRPQPVERKSKIAAGVLADIWPRITNGEIRTHIHDVSPLENASEAHRVMESSAHVGKLVLSIKNT